MTTESARGTRARATTRWSVGQLALAATASAGLALTVASMGRAATVYPLWYLIVLVPLAGIALTGTLLPLFTGALVLVAWTMHVEPGTFSWWSVGGGIGLAVWHAAVSLSAALPPGSPLPGWIVRRWAVRSGLVVLAAPLAASVASVAPTVGASVTVIATCLALTAVIIGIWWLRSEPVADRE